MSTALAVADKRDGDAMPAADLQQAVGRLHVQCLHRPEQALRDVVCHEFTAP
jgi:hypothetical protein